MKNQQRQQAQSLYLQSGLNKTQVAEHLGVSRRTIYQWSLEGSWDKLRKSAQHMPAILAEKCYYLIGHFTDHLLNAESMDIPIGKRDVDMLHKLTITANKLKQGSTVSESMQTFTLLLARMQCHDPALAELVAPHIESFVRDRRQMSETSFLLDGFNEEGYIDAPKEEQAKQEQTEQELDERDLAALLAEINASGAPRVQQSPQPTPHTPAQQPQAQPAAKQTTNATITPPTPNPSTTQPKQSPQPAKNKLVSYRDRNKSLYSRTSSALPHEVPAAA